MKSRSPSTWMLLLLACLWLASCTAPAKTTQAQNKTTPAPVKPTKALTPTPKKAVVTNETGAVTLQLIDVKSGRPITHKLILLSELLPVHGQYEGAYVPAMDPVSSPKDESDDQGNVIISGAKPNRYAVTLLTPVGPILLQDMDTGKDLLVEAKAGEIVNLGTKKVSVPDDIMNP
jgi:hypothetical protein